VAALCRVRVVHECQRDPFRSVMADSFSPSTGDHQGLDCQLFAFRVMYISLVSSLSGSIIVGACVGRAHLFCHVLSYYALSASLSSIEATRAYVTLMVAASWLAKR
jgi:hypothetical protein